MTQHLPRALESQDPGCSYSSVKLFRSYNMIKYPALWRWVKKNTGAFLPSSNSWATPGSHQTSQPERPLSCRGPRGQFLDTLQLHRSSSLVFFLHKQRTGGKFLLFCLKLTSARRTILFPSGQMTWSTWDLTLSQVSSGVRRLA